MNPKMKVSHQEGMTTVDSPEIRIVFHRELSDEDAIRAAREYHLPVHHQPKKKTNRGGHLRSYWQYRKDGGTLGMNDYFKQIKGANK